MALTIKLNNNDHFKITNEMTGKMQKMWSLNTSPSTNKFCLSMRQNPNYICSKCYSKASEHRWKSARSAWSHNSAVLSSKLLADNEVPDLSKYKNCPDIFRMQAHGDLVNDIHYRNLIKIAEKNSDIMFALWTKNLVIVRMVGLIQLDNLINVFSTFELNNPHPYLPIGFDKVFSVYTKEFAEENNININCGAKECFSCRLCYTKNDIMFINEIAK